jgi:hypothetical protein
MKTGKIGKFRSRPSRVHRFSRSTGRIKKKLIVRKSFLCLPLLESKSIFFNSIIGRDMNDSERTISNHQNDFEIILFGIAVLFIYVFRSPLQYFCLFALSVPFSLYVANERGDEKT